MPLANTADIKLITFDCYGTLIDWENGLRASLSKFDGFSQADIAELVQEYVRTEASLEQQAYQPYHLIQKTTLQLLADRFRFNVAEESTTKLSEDIGNWPPFTDTIAVLKRLKSRFLLGILSNIDVDLFAQTNKRLEVDFDLIITAEDVCSYKPSHAHFLRASEQTGLEKSEILHVAQSLYHDAQPAEALGFPFIWINRYNQPRPKDVEMLAEFSTLAAFADELLA